MEANQIRALAWFLAFAACILTGTFGHMYYKISCREQAMESFCQSHYGSSYTVDTWSDGGHANTFEISCKMSTSSQVVQLSY